MNNMDNLENKKIIKCSNEKLCVEDTIIDKSNTKSTKFLDNVKTVLNNTGYGDIKSKKAIIELLEKWIKDSPSHDFVGPPGVGKYVLAPTIEKALGTPFKQIALGGLHKAPLMSNRIRWLT